MQTTLKRIRIRREDYFFRDSFNAEAHAKELQPKQLDNSMGTNLKSHIITITRFTSKDLENAFDAANKPKVKVAA